MNSIIQEAYNINQKGDCKIEYLPEVEVGEEVEINDIWDGNGDDPTDAGSVSYKISNCGVDGESNCPVWINYRFEVVEKKENPLDTIVRITEIELL